VLNELNWDGIYEWKKQPKTSYKAKREDHDVEETAGTVKKYKNLYFATIYNSGHMAPE
jgi:carboxypeptidase C (cathepsin A)